MNVFIYIMIFIAGTVFGSFCSLAVYRIPRKENITYVRSHCVKCNHKLAPLDLIPILSYIFLGGRCRYCREKIRARYILLEASSGLVFLLIALSLKINVFSTLQEFINLFLIYLFVTGLFLVGGIDKENYVIPDSILLYLIGISILKIILNATLGISALTNIVGFLAIPAVLLVINLVSKLNKKTPIGYGDIKYISVIGLFLGYAAELYILPLSLIIAGIGYIIHKYKEIPWGYYLSIATVIMIICINCFPVLSEIVNI